MITRRTMLLTSAAVGAVTFAATLPGMRAAALAGPPLRRSLKDMDLDDEVLVTLRSFVTMMNDPARNGQNVSWVGFSNIHGDMSGFNKCPHGNWYFLPWHRGYVRMYEQAARALTGNANFAMPYWDWTAQPDFPAAFGDPTFDGQPNPLFLNGRLMTTGDQMDPSVTGQAVMDIVYAAQTFEEFGSSRASGQNSTDPMWITQGGTQGELEFNPHNNVHCDVRGPFMCSGASPQDAIFQMHHCNIDRIWAEWVSQGRSDSSDPMWLNMPFTDNYFAPDGTPYTHVVNELLEVEPLGYTYGITNPPKPPVYPGRVLYIAALNGAPGLLEAVGVERQVVSLNEVAEPSAPLSVKLPAINRNLTTLLGSSLVPDLERAGLGTPTVYAIIRGLEPAEHDGTQLRVFVNLPDAGPDTPTKDNPNFVTSIGFFGPAGMHEGHDMKKSVAVDLTPAIRRLIGAGVEVGDDISVRLVPVAQQPGDVPGKVTVGAIELAIV